MRSWDAAIIIQSFARLYSKWRCCHPKLNQSSSSNHLSTYGYSIDKNDLDPVTLAAFSHATNGVLVNVIDPSTPSRWITYIKPVHHPYPQRAHHTTRGRKGGGFFKNLRGDTANTQPFSWESSNHSNLHLFSKLQTTFNRDQILGLLLRSILWWGRLHTFYSWTRTMAKGPNVTSTSLHVII